MAAYIDSQGQEVQASRLILEDDPQTVKRPWLVLSADVPVRYSDDEFHRRFTQRYPALAGAEPVGPTPRAA